MKQNGISKAVINRLPRYYRYLGDLLREGTERISSEALSKRMHTTASQIRQDFNHFGGFGQQGYGYNVENLHAEIGKILGLDHDHSIAIIGAGNLGRALANSRDFEKRGFHVTAMFDIRPEIIGTEIAGVTVSGMYDLEKVLKENRISIVALTVPKNAAKHVADQVVACGIRAVWNFAHFDLHLPDDVVIENVHLSDSLMKLSYKLSELD